VCAFRRLLAGNPCLLRVVELQVWNWDLGVGLGFGVWDVEFRICELNVKIWDMGGGVGLVYISENALLALEYLLCTVPSHG